MAVPTVAPTEKLRAALLVGMLAVPMGHAMVVLSDLLKAAPKVALWVPSMAETKADS